MAPRSAPRRCSLRAAVAAVGTAGALSGCLPVPGASVAMCVLCLDSSASVTQTTPAADAGDALPALPPLPAPPAAPGADPAPAPAAPAPASEPPPAPAPEGESAPIPAPDAPAATAEIVPESGPGAGPERPALADTVRAAEGLALETYPDAGGVTHICHGHQVTVRTCDALLDADLAAAEAAAARIVGAPAWDALDAGRRDVLIELAYWVGPTGLARFERLLAAVRAGDFDGAADELLASRLPAQAPARAERLAAALRAG